MEYKIEPHIGVGAVRLGTTREQVYSILGEPQSSHNSRETFLNGFMVDFDSNGIVEFIELVKSPQFRTIFEGVCLHEILAEDAILHVSQYDSYDEKNSELGYSYFFPNLGLSLWRGTLPDDGQDANDPDGRYFETVAIARDGYWN